MSWIKEGACLVLSLFALRWREGVCGRTEFGCRFDDKDYNFELIADSLSARFGKQLKGVPEYYIEFYDDIESIYVDFLKEGLTYNSIRNYFRFHNKYRKLRAKLKFPSFMEFLRHFKVSMKDGDEPVGNILELMKLMVDELPVLNQGSYLVTASPFDSEMYNATLDPPEDSQNEPHYWKHRHVAGVIRFVEKKQGRVAYVLLDPKYLNRPVVVMEDDGDIPFKHEWLQSVRHLEPSKDIPSVRLLWYPKDHPSYSESRKKSNFIIGKYLQDNGSIAQISYFFKLPFCSFVEHTVKPSLLSTERTLKKFDEINKPFVELVTNVKPFIDTVALSVFLNVKKCGLEFDGWKNYELPTNSFEEISTGVKRKSSEIELLCKSDDISVKLKSQSCTKSWIKRIKKLKVISMDQSFLLASQSALNFYEGNRDGNKRKRWIQCQWISDAD